MVRGEQAARCDLNSSEGGQTSLTFTDQSLKRRQTGAQIHRLRRATPQLVHSEATGDGSYCWKTVLPFYLKGHNLAQRLPSSLATCGSAEWPKDFAGTFNDALFRQPSGSRRRRARA
jgi:hypothetical protein